MPEAGKPLRRSKSDRVIAGVCGGIAAWGGWDPTLVRVLYVVLALVSLGSALVVYLVLWLVLPQADE